MSYPARAEGLVNRIKLFFFNVNNMNDQFKNVNMKYIKSFWRKIIFYTKNHKWNMINTTQNHHLIIIWFFLAIRPYQPLLLAIPLDGTQSLHRADECKFLLVGQYCCVGVNRKTSFMSLSFFSATTQDVPLVLLE